MNYDESIEQFTPAAVATNSADLGGVQQYSYEAMLAMSPNNTAASHLPDVRRSS